MPCAAGPRSARNLVRARLLRAGQCCTGAKPGGIVSVVVPANAGPHTPCRGCLCKVLVVCLALQSKRQGLWVPAFAGTTTVCSPARRRRGYRLPVLVDRF